MLCEDIVPELPAFLDGELSPVDREAIAAHLAGCRACEAERVAIARMIERVRALPRVAAPVSLANAVTAAVTRQAVAAPGGETSGPRETCGSLEAADLSAFLDGELPEADRDRTREHVAVCPICAETLVWLDDVSGRVRVLPRVAAPTNLLAIILARIDDLVRGAAAPAAPAASRRVKRPWLRGGAPRTAEPFQVPPGVGRFLAAASVLILALGSLAVATPNTSAEIADQGFQPRDYAHNPAPEPPSSIDVGPAAPAPDPDRIVAIACDDPDAAVTAFYAVGASSKIQVFATNQTRTLGLTGSVQDLRPALKQQLPETCALEDASRVDEFLPPPLDQVFTRSGEVLQGVVEQRNDGTVLLATVVRAASAETLATPAAPGTGLAASYWEIPPEAGEIDDVAGAFLAVEGRAAFARIDPTVNVQTPDGGIPGARGFNVPFAQTARLAVRWHGYVSAERAGPYAFNVGADDGALLEVDNVTVVNADGRHGYANYGGWVDLTKGLHSVELRYFNGGGPGGCVLSYTPPGGQQGVVPQGILYDPDRIEAGRRALTLTIPRRSVVRVKPASHEPVTVYVLLRRRSE